MSASTDSELDRARDVLQAAWRAAFAAEQEAIRVEAQFDRMLILRIADEHPELLSVTWEMGWDSDKGNFFETCWVHDVELGPPVPARCQHDASTVTVEHFKQELVGKLDDEVHVGADVCRLLTGTTESDEYGTVTIEALREMKL